MRFPRLLSLTAAALFLAAGPLAARAADACSLLNKDEIKAVTKDPVTHSGGMPTSCIWSGKDSTVYLGIRNGSTWSAAKAGAQKFGMYEAASGVGDDAFFQPPNDARATLFAHKGGNFITVRLNVNGLSAAQTKAALQTLANEALGSM